LLILLIDGAGRWIAAHDCGRGSRLRAANVVSNALVARLGKSDRCLFAVTVDEGYGLAFAFRLASAADRPILGGVVELSETAQSELLRLCEALVACGKNAFSMIAARRRIAVLRSRLRRQRKLEAAGKLAAGVSHELSTPAQYVRDNTRFVDNAFSKLQSLLSACLDLKEAGHHGTASPGIVATVAAAAEQVDLPLLMQEVPAALEESLDGIDRMLRLVQSMRKTVHADREPPPPENLAAVIRGALATCRSQWKDVADIVTDLGTDVRLTAGLPDDMHRIVVNLVVNAAQAIAEEPGRPPGRRGCITIKTRRSEDGRLELRVEDNGPGIAADARPHVFQRFFTTKASGQGTGQGLAIVRSLVVGKYGGDVTFTTEVGEGTAFVVRLPGCC